MQVGIIGANTAVCSPELYEFAIHLGHMLAEYNHFVVNGGMGGVMEAVSKGVKQHPNTSSLVIGILPEAVPDKGNPFLDIVIPTGIGYARNMVLVNSSDILIALGGGAGTLNEISYAWQAGKKVFCYTGSKGWSMTLAGASLDERRKGLLEGFNNLKELENTLNHVQNPDVSQSPS